MSLQCTCISCSSAFGIMTGKMAWDKHLVLVILLDFSLTVKAAPHDFVIRTNQP